MRTGSKIDFSVGVKQVIYSFQVDIYRVISLCCGAARPIDALLNFNLQRHCLKNDICASAQHGLLPGRSTVSNILFSTTKWINQLDTCEFFDVVFIDLKKAFSFMSHPKLQPN